MTERYEIAIRVVPKLTRLTCVLLEHYRLRVPVDVICVVLETMLELHLQLIHDRLAFDAFKEFHAQVGFASFVSRIPLKSKGKRKKHAFYGIVIIQYSCFVNRMWRKEAESICHSAARESESGKISLV